MSSEIKVDLVDRKRSPYWQMRYRDSVTETEEIRSSRVRILPKLWARKHGRRRRENESEAITIRRNALRSESLIQAEKVARNWAADLRHGIDPDNDRLTWEEFRERFEAERLTNFADRTRENVLAAFNSLERTIQPRLLRSVTSAALSKLQAALRKRGLSDSTVKTHIAHLRSALRWAFKLKLLREMPAIPDVPRAASGRVMKGRPITTKEFERMLDSIEEGLFLAAVLKHRIASSAKEDAGARTQAEIERREADRQRWIDSGRDLIAANVAPTWSHLLNGLWLSGLRLSEALKLRWDGDSGLLVCLPQKFDKPMLLIPAAHDKGRKDRILPMAPEFAEFLLKKPHDERKGFVFQPALVGVGRATPAPRNRHAVGPIISAIGEAAGVVVQRDERTGKEKFASAHDLRRSFGERWAREIMPHVLMELMRHESIETTNKYYVGRNAQATAEILWQVHARRSAHR